MIMYLIFKHLSVYVSKYLVVYATQKNRKIGDKKCTNYEGEYNHKAKDLKINHELFMVDAEKSIFVCGHVNINDLIFVMTFIWHDHSQNIWNSNKSKAFGN